MQACPGPEQPSLHLMEREGAREAGEGRDQPAGDLFHAMKGYSPCPNTPLT